MVAIRTRRSENRVQEAAQHSEKDSSGAAGPLLAALQMLDPLTGRVQSSQISSLLKEDLLEILHEKLEQAQTAINLAMNVTLEATVAPPQNTATLPKEEEALTTVSPGQKFLVRVKFHNGSKNKLVVDRIRLDAPQGWAKQIDEEAVLVVAPGKDQYANFVVQIPVQAADGHYYTRPYWHRSNPETESINTIDDERYVTLPGSPPPFHATVQHHIIARRTT